MQPCEHLPGPGEINSDGECIHCVRERERAHATEPAPVEVAPVATNEIRLPATLPDQRPVRLDAWLKQPGDAVEQGDEIARLSGAGSVFSASAPKAGTLGRHLVRPGAMLQASALLARVLPSRDATLVSSAGPAIAAPESETPAPVATPVVETVAEPLADTDAAPIDTVPLAKPEAPPPVEAPAPAILLEQPAIIAPPLVEPERPRFRLDEDIGRTERPDPPEEIAGSEDENIIAELRRLQEDGVFVVSLIGFFAGGKTWFLSRLKNVLSGHMIDPPAPRDGSEVRRTNNVAVHKILSAPRAGGRPQEFAIVDLPGEMIGDLVLNPLEGSNAVLAALTASGAIIVALPAEEVILAQDAVERKQGIDAKRAARLPLDGDAVEQGYASDPLYAERLDRLAFAHEQLLDFTDQLCFIAALLSTVRYAAIPFGTSLREAGISRAAVEKHLRTGKMLPFDTPTYIALTKADRVRDPVSVVADLIGSTDSAVLKAMLADPREIVLDHREELVAKFDQWFGQYKFDFVSAFEGHGHSTKINYRLPYHGVWAVIEWIAWCRRIGGKFTPSMQRARRIRERRDGMLTVPLPGLGDQVRKD